MPDILQEQQDTVQIHIGNKAVSPGHGFELCVMYVNMHCTDVFIKSVSM